MFDELLNKEFEQPSRKRQKAYGLELVKALFKEVQGSTDSYFIQRNRQWDINDKFATGRVDPKHFVALMGITNPDKSPIQIDPALLKIVPRYLQVLLQGFMNRDERASVRATGVLSDHKKERRKIEAMYKMKNAAKINEMQQVSGVQHEQGFIPEDTDQLEWHYKIADRLPEESEFEKKTDEVFQNSDDENLKREWLTDLAKYNMAASKVYEINDSQRTLPNRIKIKRCNPSSLLYNVFRKPNGEDVSIIGEIYPMSISDGRRFYPTVTEQEWFDIAQRYSGTRTGFSTLTWYDSYLNSSTRPYDQDKFMVLDFEVKTTDKDYHVKTENQFGNPLVIKKKGKPNPQNGEVIEDRKFNVYSGLWALDTDIMMRWEIAENMIRPYQNGVDCFLSYSVVCPDADGTLVISLVEKAIPIVKSLIDTYLKIQQMKRTMRPDGIAIEIGGLRNVDLGEGALTPLQIDKIYDLTGKLWWERQDIDGVPNPDQNAIPYTTIPSSANVAQINTLIQLFNFELQRLNDEWGTNPDALGQQLPARRGKQVNENQIEMANQATEYLYDFYLMLRRQTASKVVIKIWDITVLESTEYKVMSDIDIQDLINEEFDVNIEFVPVQEHRDWLEQMISLALERGSISPGQAIRIRNMDNIKDAELYLIYLEEKAQAAQAAAKQQDYQNNAQLQQQSLQSKGQMDAQLVREKAAGDNMVTTAKLELEGYNSIINMVSGMVQESMKSGTPIPANMQPVVDFVIQTTIAKGNPQPQQQEPAPEEMQEQQPQPEEIQ
jgi:hypothetical protein